MSNFVKIRQLEAELFHADGRKDGQADRQSDRQGDMAKLMVAFRSYAIEKYGSKGIITLESTISTVEYLAVVTRV
jgi:hypothetical protein